MIYKPSYNKPYLTSIDASASNVFSGVVNAEGGTAITKYSLYIEDLNGNAIYSSVNQTLSTPLYNGDTLEITVPNTSTMVNGVDYVWYIKLYEASSSMWVTYGVTQAGSTAAAVIIRNHYNVENGMYLKIGSEKRKITTYVQSTGVATLETAFSSAPPTGTSYTVYSDYIESDTSYFKARALPVVSITDFGTVITNRLYSFVGNYNQSNEIGWKYFIWNLYDSNDDIVKTSGQVTSGTINFTFDGFLRENSYKIELRVENQDGIISTTSKLFSVSYDLSELTTKPKAEVDYDKNAIKVSWKQPYTNLSTVNGTYDYVENEPYLTAKSLSIPDGSSISYAIATPSNSVLVPYAEASTIFQTQFPVGFEGEFIRFENTDTDETFYIGYYDGQFSFYIIDQDGVNTFIGNIIIQPSTGTWLLASIEDYNVGKRYIWKDDSFWNDSYLYGIQTEDILSDNWWKFTLLPTGVLLTIVPIYHESAFGPTGIDMHYNTRFYEDYNLITTDVMYI